MLKTVHQTTPTAVALWLGLAVAFSGGYAWAQPTAADDAPTLSRNARLTLETPRIQPGDFVRDILVLIDLGEAHAAQPLLQNLVAQQLSEQQRVELVHQFGTAGMLRLARSEPLGAEAQDFVQACLAAVATDAASADRLEQSIQELLSGDEGQRKAAMSRLARGGRAAVVACLAKIARTDDAQQQDRLREALVRLSPASTPALAAALDAPRVAVRRQAAWALGQVGDRPSLPRLAAMASGPEGDSPAGRAARWSVRRMTGADARPHAATKLLEAALANSLAGVPPRRPNQLGGIEVWGWDQEADQPVSAVIPAEQAGQLHAARLAADLWKLNEGDDRALALSLSLRWHGEWLLESAGWDRASLNGPAAAEASDNSLSDALSLALEKNLIGAAIRISDELSALSPQSTLASPSGKPTPLALALAYPHPAVRFAALNAVMKLAPAQPFPGSSKATDALLHFTSAGRQAAAVVAMPQTADAATLGGLLAGDGVEPIATNLGADVAKLAAGRANVEFVLVDMEVLRPGVREVLFRLRRQTATSQLPIALLAPDGRLADAKRLAAQHQRVVAAPRPHTAEAASALLERLASVRPAGWPDHQVRTQQAAAAAQWIGRLLADGPSFYNLKGRRTQLLDAVNHTPNAADSIPALALLGAPDSQAALVNMASLEVLPIETRRAAAAAFDQSVGSHGLLLSTPQILAQYERYNQSQHATADTQQVLGQVLDSIESLRKAKLTK